MCPSASQHSSSITRRRILSIGALIALSYPLLKFIGFKVPKKPTYININNPIPQSGFFVASDFILFDRNNRCWALSRRCTHLGCKLSYQEELDVLECPCHHSRFNSITGEVIKGPAKQNLTFYPVEKRDKDPLYVVTT